VRSRPKAPMAGLLMSGVTAFSWAAKAWKEALATIAAANLRAHTRLMPLVSAQRARREPEACEAELI
jgi:hypothetical protein